MTEDRIKKLKERVRELEEALAFYASPDTYFAIGFCLDPLCGEFMNDFSATEDLGSKPGKRARVALGLELQEDG